ncbi:hypothetical protein [Streptomyces triculaminicus]|uniref:hypothetical protein n=1 Tax=Streptomyces triculaminicus TaxID=2816232 RepID=UPI0037A7AA24
MTAPAPAWRPELPGARPGGLDALYPDAAWDLPVNAALPAPRLADPPAERCNLGAYRDYYGPCILREFPVAGEIERLAVVDKAFPHSLYDVMLLVARDDVVRRSVGDTPDAVLAALLRAAAMFVEFLSDPAVVRGFGLEDGRLAIGWNHDPTVDRDNGQWWDKRLHLHLNCWPAAVRRAVAPLRLADIGDVTMRRSLVDPAAYLAHQVMADALRGGAVLPERCRLLGPDPRRDAAQGLPVGLKVRIPGWEFLTAPEGRELLRELHTTASGAYQALRRCFTGSDDAPGAWQRPRLLPADDVERGLDALAWLSPASRMLLADLRSVLRNVTPRQMRLLAARRDLANRCLTLGGLSYNLSLFTPQPVAANSPVLAARELYVVMQFKLVSYVGNSPALGGAAASVIDRMGGPVMTADDRQRRRAFQLAYADRLPAAPAGAAHGALAFARGHR